MKHLNFLILLLLFSAGIVSAQSTPPLATGYYFSASSNVQPEDMTGATTLIGATRTDDQVSAVTPITFPFEFAGHSYSAFQAFSSGSFILTYPGFDNSDFHLLSAWSDAIGTGDNGHISYKVIGTTNRKLVVEYFMGDYIGNTAFPMNADKKFQVWLYENSNKIQFVYGNGTVYAAQAYVGILGSANTGDLVDVNTATHELIDVPFYYNTTWPGFGQSYTFSPTPAQAVEPSVVITTADATTVCEGGSVTFTSVLNDGSATGYQWLKNGAEIAGATASTYTATESGSYSVQVFHASGTATSANINVFVTALSAGVSSSNISCNATNNGTITVTNPTGANGIYEYSIGNNVWQESPVFTGLAAGSYNVQMRADNCVKSLKTVVITNAGTSPVVKVTTGSGGACANITLTANPADAANYLWSNGETSRSITLDYNDANGVYTVQVSNGNGCTGSGSFVYNKTNQLKSYAIVALKSVLLGENNTVNGAVGNKGTFLPIYISRYSKINGFISAPYVGTGQSVSVSDGISYLAPAVEVPTVYTNTSVTNRLSNGNVADNFVGTLSSNYNSLTIGKRAKVTLAGTVFGKVTVKEGAQVTFSAADISIDNLETEDGKITSQRTDLTTVSFIPNAIIRIKNKVEIGSKNRIKASGATFYLSDLRQDDEKFIVDGSNTILNGNVILPNGILAVRGADAINPCTMNGEFICEYIVSDKYVTWNRNECNTFAPRVARPVVAALPVELKADVYPNPGTGAFKLIVKTTKATRADVIIVNESGAEVKKETFVNVQPGQTLPINISNQPSGIYMIRLVTTEGIFSTKVVLKK